MVDSAIFYAFRRYFRFEHMMLPTQFGTAFRFVVRFPRGQVFVVQQNVMEEEVWRAHPNAQAQIAERVSQQMIDRFMDSMETWIRIAKDEITFKEILGIQDIEQRMVALKRYGVEKILHDAKAELLNESSRGNELYKIPIKAGLFSVDAYYLKYKDPSTGRQYISGVPPQMGETKNADACMAWKHGLSTKAYLMLEPLVTES